MTARFTMQQMREFDALASSALLDGEWPDEVLHGRPPDGQPMIRSDSFGVAIWATTAADGAGLQFWREDLPSPPDDGI